MGRLNVGQLQHPLRFQGVLLCARRRHIGPGQDHGCTIVILDDLREHLTRMHMLEILHRQIVDIAAHLRGNRGDVRLQISVIRHLPAWTTLPAIPACRDNDEDGDRDHEN
jgi:hypothetical protein